MRRSLSEAVQEGRQRLQDEITSLEPRLRRRLHGKLVSTGWFDVDDILESVRRRMDLMLVEGRLPVLREPALSAYVRGVAEKIALEKTRTDRRKKRLELFIASRSGVSLDAPNRMETHELLDLIIRRLSVADRQLLELWVQGHSRQIISERLGMSLEAYRTRRRRLLLRVKRIARC